MPKIVYTDSLGFLAPAGQPPIFDPANPPQVSLMHLTSVPPIPVMYDFDTALAAHKKFREQALSNPGVYEVLTAADLDKPGLGLVFGMQHAPNGLTLDRVQQLFDAGVRVMALAYADVGEYGSGYKAEGGLTKRGKKLLRWVAQVGMILDLSHANEQTAADALHKIEAIAAMDYLFGSGDLQLPAVMASHSGCYAIHSHPRNVSDEIIRRIYTQGGYIGIPAMNFVVGPDGIPGMAQHIEHVNQMYDDMSFHVGIGSDCPHLNMPLDEAQRQYDKLAALLGAAKPDEVTFPDRPLEFIKYGSALFPILREVVPLLPDHIFGATFWSFLSRSLPQT